MIDKIQADKDVTQKDTHDEKNTTAKKTVVKKSPQNKAVKSGDANISPKPVAPKTVTKKAVVKKVAKKKAVAVKLSDKAKNKADDAIRSKKSVNDLKARASAAKKRAQQKILDKSYVSDPPVDPLERLANRFDDSAKRWEMVVYPSLFAFVLLAGYGFYLIYRLTHDISTLSQSVTRMAVIVSDAMPQMSTNLDEITISMNNMDGSVKDMNYHINGLNSSVYGMQRDMHGMNRTVSSGPLGMMNDMMPFSSNSNVPPPMNRPYNYAPQNRGRFAPRPKVRSNRQWNKQPTTQPQVESQVYYPQDVPVTLSGQLEKEKNEKQLKDKLLKDKQTATKDDQKVERKVDKNSEQQKEALKKPSVDKQPLNHKVDLTTDEANQTISNDIVEEIKLDDEFFDNLLPEDMR